ncbi:MAG: 2-hydroxychromene-2-carboxylate isomerase, partial [Glaciecola sp.]
MLELFHDITSAASYVAVTRVQALADDGVEVRFHGVDMRGLAATLPVSLDTLAELEHVRHAAQELGIVLCRPRVSPPTAAAHILGDLAESLDLGAAWRTACYQAFWERGLDLGDVEILAEIGEACGLDPDDL